ncbi:MAG: hypothetical protein M1829_006405 [Trizodia sp. TS-e1964]|nr:MAG: hypothetical protein M1829_006405 [Trizodia sp. TS-e1964]
MGAQPVSRLPATSSYTSNPSVQLLPPKISYQPSLACAQPGETIAQYSPAFMLPSQDSSAALSNNYNQEAYRSYETYNQSARLANANSIFLEQESQSPYGNQPLSYSASSMARTTISADSPYFPGLSTLASSLPGPNPISDRILPNPIPGRGQTTSVATHAHSSPVDNIHGVPSQAYDSESESTWKRESAGPSNPATVSSASTELTLIRGLPSTLQEYTPPSESSSASSNYSSSSTEARIVNNRPSTNPYNYSAESRLRHAFNDSSSTASGTLVSGQPYIRLAQPIVQQPPTLLSSRSPIENRPLMPHVQPISSFYDRR